MFLNLIKIIYIITKKFFFLFSQFFAVIILFFLKFFNFTNIRFVKIKISNIGNSVLELYLYLNEHHYIKKKHFFFFENKNSSNKYLNFLINKNFKQFPFAKSVYFLSNKYKYFNEFIYEMPNWWNRDKTNFSTNKLFIPKAFLFSSKQDQEGYSFLKKNNYDNQKIVCLILRDGAYHKFFGDPKKDYSYHNYRNVDIGSYILSIKYLLKKNYFVVRMGSVNEKKLNFKNKNYLEYSEIKNKNDFLDFWIISKSFMCITTGTGVDEIGAVYQVPTLDSNFFPCGVIRSGQRNCLTIFKKIMKKKNQELVNLSEMISMDFCGKETFKGFSFYQKNEFKNNFKLLDNSPKEILDALIELELRTLNQYDESSANLKNQELFWNIYKSSGIYDKFIKELNTKSTIGKKYLEENNWLLM